MSRSTAHLQQPVPVLALVAAILRLKARREEQLRLWKQDKIRQEATR